MATLYILYGSATGNAEGISLDLAEKTLPAHFSSVVCQPLENFKKYTSEWSKPPTHGKKHGLILICSTTGNGDAPENANRFVRYIKRKQTIESKPFQHCVFSVLGLGDTNYDQFCQTGKILDKKMVEVGAIRAKPLVCADEATDMEESVDQFMEQVLADIERACVEGDASFATMSEMKKSQETFPLPTEAPTPVVPAPIPATTAPAAPKESGPLPPPPEKSDSPLFILYGSATGNAESIAIDLAETYEAILGNPDTKTYFPSVVCMEADQFKKKCLPTWETDPVAGTKHGLVVVASTTGNGDAPENCGRFVRFLKRKSNVDAQPLRNVGFAVLGLGDTNYDQFCQTGKSINKKLEELGGTRAMALACADEATGLEDVVEPWTHKVLLEITNVCRGSGAAASTNTTVKTASRNTPQTPVAQETNEEEKKIEIVDMPINEDAMCIGLRTVRFMMNVRPGMPMTKVEFSWLPSLRPSRSSCELLDDDCDHQMDDDVSVLSSGSQTYSMNHPYSAQIKAARYLTASSTEGASRACEKVGGQGLSTHQAAISAREAIDTEFPLDGDNVDIADRNAKRVIEMSLSLPEDSTLEYHPGDAVGLITTNSPAAVSFVLNMLKEKHGLRPEQKISIDENLPITIEQAVRENMDLCCVLKNKRILYTLAQCATDNDEKNALFMLSSKTSEGAAVFDEYIVKQRRSAVDMLQEFPSLQNITLEGLLGVLPPIAPRYYSISSSPLDEERGKSCLTVAFSVVDYLTPSLVVDGKEIGNRRVQGVTTGYLETICAPFLCNSGKPVEVPEIRIFPKPTAEFRMPADLSKPIVLIGPGTGIAPFMGFLSHRHVLEKSMDSSPTPTKETSDVMAEEDESNAVTHFRSQPHVGEVDVFFGCRHAEHDWLYKEELKSLHQAGIIANLYTAFSRDAGKKEYVQDIMTNNSDCRNRLVDLILKQSACVYICGDGNRMASDVQVALATILAAEIEGDKFIDSGKALVEDLKQQGRLVLDIW
eukprot:CAMPEP_0113633590 /NCGR_PEP_ID=MMETSP0017_2-20120614/17482_1 /TAXON_ID=2856 /ORGANISM="Cylindrotheca closterium" /LENGTH=997 /DNA_ID=CAMNT_0000544237 /DNA_START=154 /DNA_END=3144 /DNA_ORIENTATION=- /assembly_acc=CAM_ASM_000147